MKRLRHQVQVRNGHLKISPRILKAGDDSESLRRREREFLLILGPPNRGQSPNDEHMKMKTSKFKKEYLGKEYQRPWVSPTCPLRPRSMSTIRLTSRGALGAPHVSEAGQCLILIFLLLMIRSRRGSHIA